MILALTLLACGTPEPVAQQRAVATPTDLEAHCTDEIGEPSVEEVVDGVFVARGFDLANTIVIQTEAGRVVVDPGMSPARSKATRAALDEVTSGPVHTIVFTHSHIDHVGGAAVWAERDTELWATEAFTPHFFKQYGVFLPTETTRAARQFGVDVPDEALPCSALGRQADVRAALASGARLPTHNFSGHKRLTVGGVEIDLVEAHGETDDQLFVHLPDRGVLLPGDNVYTAFPNLYTIRGTRPRPTDAWVASLDAMRALDPEVLIPSHTRPLVGRDAVRQRLTAYRDGIQWVRTATVRGANAGLTPEELAASTGLPPGLADEPALRELYGQIDWSVRAIYTNELGWFDGRASQLYPLPPTDRARRLIDAMGGPEAALEAADSADDPRWALELLELLEALDHPDLDDRFADAYETLAEQTANTNGRGYLLVAARQRREGAVEPLGTPVLADDFVAGLPIEQVFDNMVTRLGPAPDVHESIVLAFTDHDPAVLTIRNGVLEVVWGNPLPGTPEPVATAQTDVLTWKRLALEQRTPAAALTDGSLALDHPLAFKAFLDRFDQGLVRIVDRMP